MTARHSRPLSLVRIRTRDGFFLDGIACEPVRKSRTALIWVPGLGSVFSSGQKLIAEISAEAPGRDIGYFKFNTRGHDIIARGSGSKLGGSAFERFTDARHDIRAMVLFVRKRGYRDIVLAGHSTGANKILYYMAKTRDRNVKGLALLGPVSDIAGMMKEIGERELQRRVRTAERIAKRDPEALVPSTWGIWTARRYLSLYRPGAPEDAFPYYRASARWPLLRNVRIPIAVVIGGRDEHLDRSAEELVESFRKNAIAARSYTGIVIPRSGHGFRKHERELTHAVVRWIQKRK